MSDQRGEGIGKPCTERGPHVFGPECVRTETLPSHSVELETTARGTITIKVKCYADTPQEAATQAENIFDRLKAKYKEVNDANRDFYVGKG